MSTSAYTITELCELFEMSKQYFYKRVSAGKGPLLSGESNHPTIRLVDALVFGEDRAPATSESYRGRWEAGIRRVRIDMTLARLAKDKADAAQRKAEKQAKLNE
jgi:hypothetical protein